MKARIYSVALRKAQRFPHGKMTKSKYAKETKSFQRGRNAVQYEQENEVLRGELE